MNQRGPLIILSGPSGSGKSTVVKRLLAAFPYRLRLSISVTTRDKRKSEKDGVEYHFWTRERFLDEVNKGGFLEWAEVVGNLYGTPKSEVEPYRDKGMGVILDIDVQGAESVRKLCPDHLSIFLKASTLEVLEQRLRGRGTEDEASIQRRLANARKELQREREYQHQVINDDLETAVAQVRELIEAEFARRRTGCSTS
jgi:guanylate kinase